MLCIYIYSINGSSQKPGKSNHPWIGGKRHLADHIFPRFPAHDCYVEVFAIGAAFYSPKPLAKVEVINDINGELVRLYRVVQHHLEEFTRHFKRPLDSREVFKWHRETWPNTLTDIQRAVRFFYPQQHAFGGKGGRAVLGHSHNRTGHQPVSDRRKFVGRTPSSIELLYQNTDWAKLVDRYDGPIRCSTLILPIARQPATGSISV